MNSFPSECFTPEETKVFAEYYGGPRGVGIIEITVEYNEEETAGAKKEKREPFLLPDFSAHHLRHTFCTRLCENETNLKVIQTVMGHKDIQTTMDIYADCTEEKKQKVIKKMEDKIFVI